MANQTELQPTTFPIGHFDTHDLDLTPSETHEVEPRPASSDRVAGVFRGVVFGVLPSLALWAGIAWLVGVIR